MAENGLISQLLGQLPRRLAAEAVVGRSGGGAVTVQFASGEVAGVSIAPEAMESPELLGELVAAAMNDALAQSRDQSERRATELLSEMGF